MRNIFLNAEIAAVVIAFSVSVASADAQQDTVISPYGSQAYPAAPRPWAQGNPNAISPYGAQAYPAAPRPWAQNGAISPYGAQAYPAAPRPWAQNGAISPYGAQAYPAAPRPGQPAQTPPAQGAAAQPAMGVGGENAIPLGNPVPQQGANVGGHVQQQKGAYTLEEIGAWHRVPGMSAAQPDPTQLAPGSYAAPPVPPGTVFGNSGEPPLHRPKSSTPPKRASDIWGTYPQNVIGTWKVSTGGQFTQGPEGPDRNGQQKYFYGGPEAAGTITFNADGTWVYTFAGKTQRGHWADAPDTVHVFGLDGEENFVYWNYKGELKIQSKMGRLKTGYK